MVIISTSATEVSIQAVSPELGVHFSSTASLGSVFPAQAGGVDSAAAAGWLPAGAVDCAVAKLSGTRTASAASGSKRMSKAMHERTIMGTHPMPKISGP